MIWIAIGLAVVVGLGTALITRDAVRGLRAGLYTLVFGVAVSLVLVYGGFMGG